MPFSSVVVNRPWAQGVDPQLCPQPHPSVASVEVDDVTVLTHPAAETALALDPLSSVLWAAFDGSTSLAALADDLAASVGLAPEAATAQLEELCRSLGWHGFLVEPRVPEALRTDWFPFLEPDACPSRKMGLVDAALVDLDLGPRRIRVGATADDVVTAVRAAHAERIVPADPDDEREIICANIGVAVGNRRPRHRVVDHWGNLLYGGHRREVAAAALVRLVDDRLAQLDGRPWLATPVLERDGRVIVVHRGLDGLLEQAMPRLEREGIRRYESPFARIEVAGGRAELVVVEPSVSVAGLAAEPAGTEPGPGVTPAGRYPVAALVVGPPDLPRHEVVRAVSRPRCAGTRCTSTWSTPSPASSRPPPASTIRRPRPPPAASLAPSTPRDAPTAVAGGARTRSRGPDRRHEGAADGDRAGRRARRPPGCPARRQHRRPPEHPAAAPPRTRPATRSAPWSTAIGSPGATRSTGSPGGSPASTPSTWPTTPAGSPRPSPASTPGCSPGSPSPRWSTASWPSTTWARRS